MVIKTIINNISTVSSLKIDILIGNNNIFELKIIIIKLHKNMVYFKGKI